MDRKNSIATHDTHIVSDEVAGVKQGHNVNHDDKEAFHYVDEKEPESDEEGDSGIVDLFSCLPDLEGVEPEGNPLTVRAVLIGVVLGSLVNASNVYLGLKTGFTFAATMFGAIFGFAFIRFLTAVFPQIPGIGGRFGPKENCIIQAAATGAGSMASLFAAGLPAMYRLNLLSDDPISDYGRIVCITLLGAFFGLFASVPLRKFFIINVARELNLVFPTPTATALAIRSMHAAGSGVDDAMKRVRALGYSFLGAFTHIIVSQYADGILHNWHIFTWFYIWGGYKNWAINIDNWGWYIQLTPAFFGSGILVGLNSALSWFGGTVVAYAIIGPILVHYGECVGKNSGLSAPWQDIVSFNKLSHIGEPGFVASPRYWFLWPGVMVLIVYSMVEFLLHFRIIGDGMMYALRGMAASMNTRLQARGRNNTFLEKQAAKLNDGDSFVEDFAPLEQQVPVWVWVTGTLVFLVIACIICELQFDMNAGLAILSCVLGYLFAFLAIYGAAVTDIAPITASAKATQLIYGGITKGHYSITDAQRVNLVAGNIAGATADVAQGLVGDFRVGFLLKTPPKAQFYAQAAGALVAVFLAPGIFVLFMAAYPCVWNEKNPGLKPGQQCQFAAPAVLAWQAVAQAVTLPKLPIPLSSGIFAIVMGVVCAGQAMVKNFVLVGKREKFRQWLPNWMSVGVAWVLGADAGYSIAVLAGSLTAARWKKRHGKNFETYGFAVAAGLVGGEGLAGVVNAALTLAGVSGTAKGTQIALPGGIW